MRLGCPARIRAGRRRPRPRDWRGVCSRTRDRPTPNERECHARVRADVRIDFRPDFPGAHLADFPRAARAERAPLGSAYAGGGRTHDVGITNPAADDIGITCDVLCAMCDVRLVTCYVLRARRAMSMAMPRTA